MKISQDWSPSELGRELLRTASSGPNGSAGTYGRSVAGAALRFFALGRGRRRLLLTAAHHANEWITAPLLLRFAGELAAGVWPGALDGTRVFFRAAGEPGRGAARDGGARLRPAFLKTRGASRKNTPTSPSRTAGKRTCAAWT